MTRTEKENLVPVWERIAITSKYGAHFILSIDKILMKPEYYDALINGVMKNNFPPVPVDYGYRDSTNFWYTQFPRGL